MLSRNKSQQQVNAPPPMSQEKQWSSNYAGAPNPSLGKTGIAAPRVVQVLTKSGGIPTHAFSGGSTQGILAFDLPKDVGKVTDMHAQVSIDFANSHSTNDITTRVVPSPFFSKWVDILWNGKVYETVQAEDVFVESCIWVNDQHFNLVRNYYNVGANGGFNSTFVVPHQNHVTKTWYIPLNANFLAGMQPYLKGFNGVWTIRLTLANYIVQSALNSTTDMTSSLTVTLNDAQLFLTEAEQSEGAEAQALNAHRNGVTYKTVIRNKFASDANSIANTGTKSTQLSGFSNLSAALNVYVRDANPSLDEDSLIQHYPLQMAQLKDEKGVEMTIQLPPAIIDLLTISQLPVSSSALLNTPTNSYLFPFCSNLHTVLECGDFNGGHKLTGKEQLIVTPVSALSGAAVCAVSYEYTKVIVKNGNVTIQPMY